MIMTGLTSRAGEVARIQEAWCAARGTEEGVPVPPALLVDVPRLQALLGQASGDKVIVSGTLERRLLLLQAPGEAGWQQTCRVFLMLRAPGRGGSRIICVWRGRTRG